MQFTCLRVLASATRSLANCPAREIPNGEIAPARTKARRDKGNSLVFFRRGIAAAPMIHTSSVHLTKKATSTKES
jgi:hypothetical protein